MSDLLQKALEFESSLSLSHFLEENQAAVAVVSCSYKTQEEMNKAGFEDGVELYPKWVVDELRSHTDKLNEMIEPHPPSRHCHCKTCTGIFEEKDKMAADGIVYEKGGLMFKQEPIPEWNQTNAQIATVMALTGNATQKEEARHFFAHHLNLTKGEGK
jgi:hypothetical protein